MPSGRLARIVCLSLIATMTLIVRGEGPATAPATQPSASSPTTSKSMPAYRWRLVNDAVGGPCAGIVIHGRDASIRYCYGDSGGYRWDGPSQRWMSFTDWNPDPEFGHVAAMVLDPNDRQIIYYVAGTDRADVFKSTDWGRTFVASGLKRPDGEGVSLTVPRDSPTSGERLILDPNNSNVLYLATQRDGLWISLRAAAPESWTQVSSFTARGDITQLKNAKGQVIHQPAPNGGVSLVAFDRRGGSIEIDGVRRSRVIFVGVIGDRRERKAGPGDAIARIPESGLWRSTDGGQTWTQLSGPMNADNAPTRVTIAADGDLWATISGRVVNIARNAVAAADLGVPAGANGIVAMAIDRLDPNHAVVARHGTTKAGQLYGEENRLFRTVDGGATWTELKVDAATPPWWGRFATHTTVLRFEANAPKDTHGRTRTLWLGDALGPWVCDDLDADVTHWRLISRGRGGAFVRAIACPPASPGNPSAPLLAAAEGVGGFRNRGVSAIPEQRFAWPGIDAPRTIISLSYCESDPRIVVAAGGNAQPGGTIGAISRDNGVTWTSIKEAVRGGHFGADLHSPIVVGCVGIDGGEPILVRWPADSAITYSSDGGRTWRVGKGSPLGPTALVSEQLKADPVEPRTFYLWGKDRRNSGSSLLYVTRDGGANWQALAGLPMSPAIDASVCLQAAPGASGDLWLGISTARPAASSPSRAPASQRSPGAAGLYRSTDGGQSWKQMRHWQAVYGLSFGAPAPGAKRPTVVVAGVYRGKTGIYISDDAVSLTDAAAEPQWRAAWESDNTDVPAISRCLRSLAADRQAYGRIYVGGSDAPRGLFYGEPIPQAAPTAPTNLALAAEKGATIVTWTDPVGAADYDVQRADAEHPEQWQTIASSVWQARVTDSSAKPGGKYLYRVIASNALGRSEPSATASLP